MSISISLRTKNTPYEEIYNLITQDTKNSRIIDIKRKEDFLHGKRLIICPHVISMGKRISDDFPDNIYMSFYIQKVQGGVYMKNILPEEYSSYITGGESILIKDDGTIDINLRYRIIKTEPTSYMDFRNTFYNRSVGALEGYVISLYESKRRPNFNKQCKFNISSFEELLDMFS